MEMVLTGLSHLAAADPTALAAQAQAECLQAFEQADAVTTAARARFLGAFTAGQGYCEDADYSPTSWLIHRTKVTKGAARGHLGWARRVMAHPQVAAALAEGTVLTESMARIICEWTGKLPRECRGTADDILIAAARAGARKEDLAALAAEIYARSLPDPEDDPAPAFEDRQLRLETTFAGAGVISGDLTPECAAVVTAVLDALSAPMGAEDTRTREQRYHDALEEAMRRLVASGLLPERAGQPVKVWRTSPWPSCGPWMTGRFWRASGSPRCGSGGPPAAPGPPTAAAVTAPPARTAPRPAPWPATRSSPLSSPGTSTPAPWTTWSGCASTCTASITTPATGPPSPPIPSLPTRSPRTPSHWTSGRRKRCPRA
jgi:hypothetical protein